MKRVLLLVAALFLLANCASGHRIGLALKYRIVRIPTGNMQPTIQIGDSAAVDRKFYAKNPIQRFDMIVFRNPQPREGTGPDELLLKRVIGLGGDKLEIRNGKMLVNDNELKQPFKFVPHEANEEYGPIEIPAGEYFLMGDNRPNSFDSRFWDKHTIDKSFIYGKVVEIIPGDQRK